MAFILGVVFIMIMVIMAVVFGSSNNRDERFSELEDEVERLNNELEKIKDGRQDKRGIFE